VLHVNKGDTPESGWIHIQCVLFLVGFAST